MTFTAFYAELSVIGLEAAIWIVLLFETAYGNGEVLLFIDKASGNIGLSFVALGIVYVLGCIIDRIADALLGWIDDYYKRKFGFTVSSLLVKENEKQKEYLSYARLKCRILRATSFNLPIITVCGSIYTLQHNNSHQIFITIIFTGTVFSILSIVGYMNGSKNFYKNARFIQDNSDTCAIESTIVKRK